MKYLIVCCQKSRKNKFLIKVNNKNKLKINNVNILD